MVEGYSARRKARNEELITQAWLTAALTRTEKFPEINDLLESDADAEPGRPRRHSKYPGRRTVSQFIARSKQTGSWRDWQGGESIGRSQHEGGREGGD